MEVLFNIYIFTILILIEFVKNTESEVIIS